jgi:hypothetical protein
MLAAPGPLLDAAKIVAALTVLVGAAAALSRSKPVRWVWRALVSQPVGQFFRAEVESTVGPRIDALHDDLHAHRATVLEAHTEMKDQINAQSVAINERIDRHTNEEIEAFKGVKEAVAGFDGRLAAIETAVLPPD